LFSSAGYSYAINRRTEVGVNYAAGRFVFPNRFGNSMYQNIGIGMGRQLSRNAIISGTIGVAQIDSLSNGIIALDPEMSAILGVATVTQVNDARRRFMTGSLSAGYATDWAYLRATAQRGMVPGNGILYGGVRDLVSVGASRGFTQSRLTTGISASMSRISGVLQSEVQVRYQAAATVSYSIARGVFMNVSGGFRWQRLAMTGPFFNQEFVSASIGWTPESYPLHF
jgi:hypothetical protein